MQMLVRALPAAEGTGLSAATKPHQTDPPPLQQCAGQGRELALLPEMLPSSHLPAPSNPVEELEALKVSLRQAKQIWGSAGGCWGGV